MISIEIDASDIINVISPMRTAGTWVPKTIHKEMRRLGKRLVPIMRDQLKPHRYTGTLEESVGDEYDESKMELMVGPDARRGRYSAGRILQEGTRPISGVPWRPIARWAVTVGFSLRPRAAYWAIRNKGVQAHPYLSQTIARADFGKALEDAATAMATELSVKAISGGRQQA